MQRVCIIRRVLVARNQRERRLEFARRVRRPPILVAERREALQCHRQRRPVAGLPELVYRRAEIAPAPFEVAGIGVGDAAVAQRIAGLEGHVEFLETFRGPREALPGAADRLAAPSDVVVRGIGELVERGALEAQRISGMRGRIRALEPVERAAGEFRRRFPVGLPQVSRTGRMQQGEALPAVVADLTPGLRGGLVGSRSLVCARGLREREAGAGILARRCHPGPVGFGQKRQADGLDRRDAARLRVVIALDEERDGSGMRRCDQERLDTHAPVRRIADLQRRVAGGDRRLHVHVASGHRDQDGRVGRSVDAHFVRLRVGDPDFGRSVNRLQRRQVRAAARETRQEHREGRGCAATGHGRSGSIGGLFPGLHGLLVVVSPPRAAALLTRGPGFGNLRKLRRQK